VQVTVVQGIEEMYASIRCMRDDASAGGHRGVRASERRFLAQTYPYTQSIQACHKGFSESWYEKWRRSSLPDGPCLAEVC
jgi:hypothetical protein